MRPPEAGGELRRPARAPRRTTFVSEAEWQAFDEFRSGIIGRRGELAVSRALAKAGLPVLDNVILMDNAGLTQVDHLVLGPCSIVVIETKTYAGEVTGDPDGRDWTQLVSGVAHLHQNPVHQNDRHCRAVGSVLSGLGVAIDGYVVSAGRAVFSVPLRPYVVPIGCIGDAIHAKRHTVTSTLALDAAWAVLTEAAEAGEDRRDEHDDAVRTRLSRLPGKGLPAL